MFTNIMIATDLSRDSDEMVRCATGLQRLGCRQAHLVYGLEMDDIGPVRVSLDKILADDVEKQKAMLQRAGIEAVRHLALSPVAETLERIAADNACSLLVAGSRIRSLAGDLLFGGIAATVLSNARRPLLMLRLRQTDAETPAACTGWPCAPMKHLLLPTDFSDHAAPAFEAALQYAADLAPERITLMHVQDRRRIEPYLAHRLDEFNQTDRDRLASLQRRVAAAVPAAHVAIEVSYGHPATEIVAFCAREAVSLVIMGTQGRGVIGELFLGSVSHHVARHAPTPVLLIPK